MFFNLFYKIMPVVPKFYNVEKMNSTKSIKCESVDFFRGQRMFFKNKDEKGVWVELPSKKKKGEFKLYFIPYGKATTNVRGKQIYIFPQEWNDEKKMSLIPSPEPQSSLRTRSMNALDKTRNLEDALVQTGLATNKQQAGKKISQITTLMGGTLPTDNRQALDIIVDLQESKPEDLTPSLENVFSQQDVVQQQIVKKRVHKQRVSCSVTNYDPVLDYFEKSITLYPKISIPPNIQKKSSNRVKDLNLLVCIPTVITSDIARRKALLENLYRYNGMGCKIIIFFKHSPKVLEYFNTNFKLSFNVSIIMYTHSGQTHVGWARKAIASYIFSIDNEVPVLISDDRRILKSVGGVFSTLTAKRYLVHAIDVALTKKCFISFFRNSKKDVTDYHREEFTDTKFIQQIYLGKAQNFKDFYACANKADTLDACFSRLLEDYAFNELAYYFGYDLLTFTRLQITHPLVTSIARKQLTDDQIAFIVSKQGQSTIKKAIQVCVDKDVKSATYKIKSGKTLSRASPHCTNWINTIRVIEGLKHHRGYYTGKIADCPTELLGAPLGQTRSGYKNPFSRKELIRYIKQNMEMGSKLPWSTTKTKPELAQIIHGKSFEESPIGQDYQQDYQTRDQ
jgi:hypothetical protein